MRYARVVNPRPSVAFGVQKAEIHNALDFQAGAPVWALVALGADTSFAL